MGVTAVCWILDVGEFLVHIVIIVGFLLPISGAFIDWIFSICRFIKLVCGSAYVLPWRTVSNVAGLRFIHVDQKGAVGCFYLSKSRIPYMAESKQWQSLARGFSCSLADGDEEF